MRTRLISSRAGLTFLLACVLLVFAPAVPAQSDALATHVGEPIPFRIDLPRRADISREGNMLYAATPSLSVMAITADLMQGRETPPAPITEADARQIVTDMFLNSDTALYAMLAAGLARMSAPTRDVVREIGSLNGQRAVYAKGILLADGVEQGFDAHVTVHGGVLYVLFFVMGPGVDRTEQEMLLTRIRDSFVFPPPPA
jgi:hypothetical protein